MTSVRSDAELFAESVSGVVARAAPADPGWAPGRAAPGWPRLEEALASLDWSDVASNPDLREYAGAGGVELGRLAAPLSAVDRLLGGSPLREDLVRCLVPSGTVVTMMDGRAVRRSVLSAEPLPAADGLDVHRVTGLGVAEPIGAVAWETALAAWLAAGVGYLAGVGQGALDLTVAYVRERAAFGSTLAALAPVQQLLAEAATAVRGVRLLATADPGFEALAHAGPAVTAACAACQQVTGAIGFTLEYPLHRFTQRARALSVWNDVLIESFLG